MRQVVAFIDVALADAERVAERVIAHLIASRIIEPSDDGAHRAGSAADAIGFVATELRALHADVPVDPSCANAIVEVQIGRTFYGERSRRGGLMCVCGAIRRGWDDRLDEAIAHWIVDGDDTLTCARCGVAHPFTSWRWNRVYAFASLALVFEGWPHLAPSFVRELSNLIDSRARVVTLEGAWVAASP